ncbi:MAG: hypothetical protein EP319_10000, partial [Deltaproteobacteria bacterium]
MFRESISDKLFYSLAILFVSFGLYGVFRPVVLYSDRNSTPIAQVVSITNVLRLKEVGNLAWIVADSLRMLREGDYVFTSDNSQARIKYLDGVAIELSPNTLLEISQNKQEVDVKINFGAIKITVPDSEKNINIRSGSEKISLRSKTSGAAVFELDKKLRVDMISGEAKIVDLVSKKSVLLKEDESAVVDSKKINKSETRKLKKYKFPVVKKIHNVIDSGLGSENNEALNSIKQNGKVDLRSDSIDFREGKFLVNFLFTEFDEDFDLEVSRYSDFKPMLVKKKIIASSEELQIQIGLEEIGKYFWRVGTKKGAFFVKPPPPPGVPSIPKAQDLVLISHDVESYRFTWGSVEAASMYEVEVYTNREKERIYRTFTSEINYYDWSEDLVDSYLFRVRAIDRWGQKSNFS